MKKFKWIIGMAVLVQAMLFVACSQDSAEFVDDAFNLANSKDRPKAVSQSEGVTVNPSTYSNIKLGNTNVIFAAVIDAEAVGDALPEDEIPPVSENGIEDEPSDPQDGSEPSEPLIIWSISKNTDPNTEIVPYGDVAGASARLILGANEKGPIIVVKAESAANADRYGTSIVSLAVDKDGSVLVDSSSTYTITFDTLGAEPEMAPEIVTYGKSVISNYHGVSDDATPWALMRYPLPVRLGDTYYLESWNTEVTWGDDGSVIPVGKMWSVTAPVVKDLRVYAIWKLLEANRNAVVFDVRAQVIDEPLASISVIENWTIRDSGEVLPKPTSPVAEFVGWYTDRDTWLNPFTEYDMVGVKVLTLYARWAVKTHLVQFESNGGTIYDDRKTERGATLTGLPTPMKQEAQFIGWFKDADLSDPWLSSDTVLSDIKLYAKWQSDKSFTVTFDANGGTSNVKTRSVKDGARVSTPSDPSNTSYQFVGWYKDIESAIAFNFNEPITEDITLYAKWATSAWLVSFDSEGGSAIHSKYVEANAILVSPADPTRTSFIFGGWYTSALLEDEFDFNTPITESITLHAKWISSNWNLAVVEFDTHDGSFVHSKNLIKGDLLINPVDPVKEDYMFSGWYTDADYTQAFNFNAPVQDNLTLHAKWISASANVRSVAFETMGGSVVPTKNVYAGSLVINPADPKKEGHTFNAWYTSDTFATRWVFESDLVTDNITLYAKWDAIALYTVTFETNGGSEIGAISVLNNSRITSPASPYLDGNAFNGWYKEAAFTNRWVFSTDKVNADTTLYAKWTAVTRYTVSFDANEGTAVDTRLVEAGAKISTPAAPAKDGAVFAGWYKETELKTPWNFSGDTVTKDITLYAKWADIVHYTVTFDADGGGPVPDSQTLVSGSYLANVADPSKDNYVFEGWYSGTGASAVKWYFASNKVNAPLSLKAKWAEVKYYTLSFNTQGGSAVQAQSRLKEGSNAERPADPTRDGHNFVGWYSDIEGTNAWSFSTAISGDKTIYAKWIDKNSTLRTIMFESEGGSAVAPKTVESGQKLSNVPYPTHESGTFTGWCTTSAYTTAYNFDKEAITSNITVYAKWTHTVTFKLQNGADDITLTVVGGSQVTKPSSNPSKEGYTFGGWYKESAAINQWSFAGANGEKVRSNVNLFAKWIPVVLTVTFDTDGGSKIAVQNVKYGEAATRPTAKPTHSTKAFNEWVTTAGGSMPYNFANQIKAPTTIYASWADLKHTVTFNGDGGTSPASIFVDHNTAIPILPTSSKDNASFAGWYTQKGGSTNGKQITAATPITASQTVYAHWSTNGIIVTFDTQSGSAVGDATVALNAKLTRPTDPTKTGHAFKGWYTTPDGTTAYNFNTLVKSSFVIYAQWDVSSYTVKFNENYGKTPNVIPKTEQYGNPVVFPVLSREGYRFDGWYTAATGGSRYAQLLMPANNTTVLFAHWTANP